MITVAEAENIILSQTREYGIEPVLFEQSIGRVLAENIVADRELPPCNRATMDGIAIDYQAFSDGLRKYHVKATQAAGDAPSGIAAPHECIEIMTGGALHESVNTVVRYEDVVMENGMATIIAEDIRKGQSIHFRGKDRRQNDIIAKSHQWIDATVINIAATVGKTELLVKKLPKVAILSTGDELVEVNAQPSPWQVRRSNSYAIKAVLEQFRINAALLHLPDNEVIMAHELEQAMAQYEVLLLSGGVSMGKYDHLPKVLEKLSVQKQFHKVSQRPGKPFWFGAKDNTLIFAFPGNPVSAFLCLHRYFIPWLEHSLGVVNEDKQYAILGDNVMFTPPLQYFMQVKISCNKSGQMIALPLQGNGSGDMANLLDTNAFMELPADKEHFFSGEAYRVWGYRAKFV